MDRVKQTPVIVSFTKSCLVCYGGGGGVAGGGLVTTAMYKQDNHC